VTFISDEEEGFKEISPRGGFPDPEKLLAVVRAINPCRVEAGQAPSALDDDPHLIA
jgi:hypothetical protein